MRVVISGAGGVGRSVAKELIANGHHVLLIDRDPAAIRPEQVPGAEWLQADCCEMATLEEADLAHCDVAIAATGDDKANLVHSLLAKTEYAVPRTVGRVNSPGNEWMFDDVWGVDIAVSTPRLMSALVEEAVSVGQLVSLLNFRGATNLVELTLPATSGAVGHRVDALTLPGDAVLVAIVRPDGALPPLPDQMLADGDKLLLVVSGQYEGALQDALTAPRANMQRSAT